MARVSAPGVGSAIGTLPISLGAPAVRIAAAMLRELSEPWASGERVKTAIGRAAGLARLSYWRTFDLWYRKAHRVESYEIDRIQEALRIKNEKAARNELHHLKTRLAILEARLNAGDQDFYRPMSDRIGEQLRAVGGDDRALDQRLKRR